MLAMQPHSTKDGHKKKQSYKLVLRKSRDKACLVSAEYGIYAKNMPPKTESGLLYNILSTVIICAFRIFCKTPKLKTDANRSADKNDLRLF